MLTSSVVSSVNEVSASEWDAVGDTDDVWDSHALVAALEKTFPKRATRYLVVRDGARIVARAQLSTDQFDVAFVVRGWARTAIRAVQRALPFFLVAKMLRCGGSRGPICYAPGCDRVAVTKIVTDALERLIEEEKPALVLVHPITAALKPDVDTLFPGYVLMTAVPKATLEVRWPSFDAYLASMTSSYRTEAKRRPRTAAEKKVEVEIRADFEELVPELHRLQRATAEQATELRGTVVPQEFLDILARHESSRVLLLRRGEGGEIIGFMLYVHAGKTLFMSFVGLDYQISKEYALYYKLLYETVRYAIEGKFTRVEMGLTTLFPKMSVGADVSRTFILLRLRSRFWRALSRIAPYLSNLKLPLKKPRVFKT